ncbi:3-oxoacyl-ACP synthase III family protein [Aequorivita viscosa]|uniref:3-oxoacyl-[acyl-carrier-protein] synthase-3 n=1 Tax=Aequorivita viscosa TaxID=797419 RepID=A0A1M6DV77_9FLAO|nr:ketoacyl-ACP synthase III [Aequorivita viscosa]SDW48877.1 3-oxoacyl-[acyl-carrier-protein] synthase-3 [Aequorivita viscosa]SHI77075.1 3-oxoacyl-[acyl-carrier-protein] synthase-3 [Aequorivita viscosa]
MNIKITGIGSYIPNTIAKNEAFGSHEFYNSDGTPFGQENETIIEKFKAITGISERRYIPKEHSTSDIATFAAEKAIINAGIDKEELDYIIVAHNYGDIKHDSAQSDTVPSIATRVKHNLKINKPTCVGYDMLFGCPGWIESMIQANAFIKSGIAKKCLVIGAEALSRVIDPHDRDSMIYSDGAGAAIVEATDEEGGILSHFSATYAFEEAHFIFFGESNNLEKKDNRRYIKMYGRKIYEFALNHVPDAMKTCLEQSGQEIDDVKMIFIHQANEKMDEAIINRFYKLFDKPTPNNIMPMSINKLGNSSVATVPTLYDMVLNGKIEGYSVKKGDVVIFASVGAGMNINSIVYKM